MARIVVVLVMFFSWLAGVGILSAVGEIACVRLWKLSRSIFGVGALAL